MRLVLTGISHKTASVELRERLAVTGGAGGEAVHEALRRLAPVVAVDECALIATCNRTEAYAVLGAPGSVLGEGGTFSTEHPGEAGWQEQMLAFFAGHGGLPAPRLQP